MCSTCREARSPLGHEIIECRRFFAGVRLGRCGSHFDRDALISYVCFVCGRYFDYFSRFY